MDSISRRSSGIDATRERLRALSRRKSEPAHDRVIDRIAGPY
jgi:hypothetical protein